MMVAVIDVCCREFIVSHTIYPHHSFDHCTILTAPTFNSSTHTFYLPGHTSEVEQALTLFRLTLAPLYKAHGIPDSLQPTPPNRRLLSEFPLEMGESGRGEEGAVEGGVGGDVVVRTRVGRGKGEGKGKGRGEDGRGSKGKGAAVGVGVGRGEHKKKGQGHGNMKEPAARQAATGATATDTGTGAGAGADAGAGLGFANAVVAVVEDEDDEEDEDEDDEEDEREFLIGHLQNPLRTRRALEAMQVRLPVMCDHTIVRYHSIVCTFALSIVSPSCAIPFAPFRKPHSSLFISHLLLPSPSSFFLNPLLLLVVFLVNIIICRPSTPTTTAPRPCSTKMRMHIRA